MNKQELIEKIKEIPRNEGFLVDTIEINRTWLLRELKQLEPQKPVVPQFVAGWIKYCKRTGVDLYHALEMGDLHFYNYANQKDFKKLHEFMKDEGNQETFAQAYMFGYTIKEEKQYLVKLKGVIKGAKVLKHNKSQDTWYMGTIYGCDSLESFHTKEELEKAGFGEVFNSPLFEVEEATK